MNIQIRFYKRFDADLISLFGAGVRVNAMIRDALYGLAHGTPRQFLVPQAITHDLNDQQFVHTSINITDPDTIAMLKSIKRGYRCSFCKMVLRDALVFQALGVYFADPAYVHETQARIDNYLTSTHEGVDVCRFRKKKKTSSARVLGDDALKEDVRKVIESAMNIDSSDRDMADEKMREDQISLDIPDNTEEDSPYEQEPSDLLNLFNTILETTPEEEK